MEFSISKSIEILSRTPYILENMLADLSDEWLFNNEGTDTWSPYDITGHLIHGEKTDWIVRANIILSESANKTFEPFDRFAQLKNDKEQPIAFLLEEFRKLRENNLDALKKMDLSESALDRKGIHPELGEVNLRQLLSSWVVHDLGHIAQISRVMAKQYKDEVGVWKAYMSILHQ